MAKKIIKFRCVRCAHTTDTDFQVCPACGIDQQTGKDTRTKIWTSTAKKSLVGGIL